MQNGDHCVKREFNFQNPSLPFSGKKKKKLYQKLRMRFSYLSPATPCLSPAQHRSGLSQDVSDLPVLLGAQILRHIKWHHMPMSSQNSTANITQLILISSKALLKRAYAHCTTMSFYFCIPPLLGKK